MTNQSCQRPHPISDIIPHQHGLALQAMEKGTIQELNTILQNQHKCPTEKYGGPMVSCHSFPVSFCTSSHKRCTDHATRNRMVCRSLRPQLPRLAIPSTLVQNGAASNDYSLCSAKAVRPQKQRNHQVRGGLQNHGQLTPLPAFASLWPAIPRCFHCISPRSYARRQQVGRNPFHARPQITSTS